MTQVEATRRGVILPHMVRLAVFEASDPNARVVRVMGALFLALAAVLTGCDQQENPSREPAASVEPTDRPGAQGPEAPPAKSPARTDARPQQSEEDPTMLDLPRSDGPDVRLTRSKVRGLHGVDLVMRIHEEILSAPSSGNDKADFCRLTCGQRIVLVVEALEGEVNNGGFDQYFFNSSGNFAPEAVAALREIGMGHFADILAEAMALFPNGALLRDQAQREAALEKVDESRLNALDERFFNAYRKEEEISVALERYVNAHAADFFHD